MHLNIILILLVVSNRVNIRWYPLDYILLKYSFIKFFQVQDTWYKEDLYVEYK